MKRSNVPNEVTTRFGGTQPRPIMTWFRRILISLAVLLVVPGSLGALWQVLATARDQQLYSPPGRLIDVGDHRLHLYCVGTGSPTVVLEAVAGGTSVDWGWVQPEVGQTTRVCSYDRAGRGWSDDGPGPRDARRIATELHMLLANGGEAGPYVLVGHSLGGLFVRQFAALYPHEVVGMVLVDARHEEYVERSSPEERAAERSELRLNSAAGYLAPMGLMRLYFGNVDPAPGLAEPQHGEVRAFLSSTRFWQSWRAEQASRAVSDDQVRSAGKLGGVPLVVVTRGQGVSPSWAALQQELTELSSNSVHLTVAGATHISLAYDRDDAHQTSGAIVSVVAAVRSGQPLRQP